MKFTVDRAKWLRGKREESTLLNSSGFRCCIGFVGQQCGIPDADLLDRSDIDCRPIETVWPKWMQIIVRSSGYYADIAEAYRTNDNPRIDDAERESRLQNIFSRNGDEIKFVG